MVLKSPDAAMRIVRASSIVKILFEIRRIYCVAETKRGKF